MTFAPGSVLAPRRGPRPAIRPGGLAHKKQWGTWELLIMVDGRRHYVGSFLSYEAGSEARDHVYQERLAGRPIPVYTMTAEQRSDRALKANGERWRRKRAEAAGRPAAPKRERIAIPRDGAPVARCRCSLALPCANCIPTARDFADSRRSND